MEQWGQKPVTVACGRMEGEELEIVIMNNSEGILLLKGTEMV